MRCKKQEPMLSAIQIKKGLIKKHETSFAALVETREGKKVYIPFFMVGVLGKF